MTLAPIDKTALEIGRLFLRAHLAEQQLAALAARNRELEAKSAESESAETKEDTE